MATTSKTHARRGSRSRASGRGAEDAGERDGYDLLGAAIIGVLAGAGLMMLIRRERTPRRRDARALVRMAGKGAARYGRRGFKQVAGRASSLLDHLPIEEIGASLGDQLAAAREAIDDVVADEVKDLRKAIRRQRRRLGV
ncbi:MAG TPA: hypothetical protein VFJ96_09320 [Gemmatimonadaceae bacterium]|nr:hypothetical protein [Gemmatimonadaceae bacterium]